LLQSVCCSSQCVAAVSVLLQSVCCCSQCVAAVSVLQQCVTDYSVYLSMACYTQIEIHTVQHTATHCNTLQHTATDYSVYLCMACYTQIEIHTVQHTATHCNTLQHTVAHSNITAYICVWCRTHILKYITHGNICYTNL